MEGKTRISSMYEVENEVRTSGQRGVPCRGAMGIKVGTRNETHRSLMAFVQGSPLSKKFSVLS